MTAPAQNTLQPHFYRTTSTTTPDKKAMAPQGAIAFFSHLPQEHLKEDNSQRKRVKINTSDFFITLKSVMEKELLEEKRRRKD